MYATITDNLAPHCDDAVARAIAMGWLHAGNISADTIRQFGKADHNLRGRLQYGHKILSGQAELGQYLWSYGNMVRNQWQGFFAQQPVVPGDAFHLVDYGCGQGLAMANVLDLAKGTPLDNVLTGITLIEPSADALAGARAIARVYAPQVACTALHSRIEHIRDNQLPHASNGQYLHLFSNVLDIASFNPTAVFTSLLRRPGIHTVWAVSHNRDFDGGAPLLRYWADCVTDAVRHQGNVQLHRSQLHAYRIAMSNGQSNVVGWQAQLEVA